MKRRPVNGIHDIHRAAPIRRLRKASDKQPMPKNLEPIAAKAARRHEARHANPGVAVDVEKATGGGYRLASPHNNTAAWHAMVCDALGTRSEATALTFLTHLTKLCDQIWHPTDDNGRGERVPDERELNMILDMVTSIKPRNAMQAALAAQMVAVHLMQMKVAERCLSVSMVIDPHLAAVAGKLARTFALQTETLAKLQGRRTSRQTITVRYEKHDHKHVHIHRGEEENGGQPHAQEADAPITALLSQDTALNTLPSASSAGEAGVPDARRKKPRRAKGSR